MTEYKQLVEPDVTVVGDPGFSLAFVQETFNTDRDYATAWDAWNATKHKHTSKMLPDAYVVVWFASIIVSDGKPRNIGHVGWWDYKNSEVVASPNDYRHETISLRLDEIESRSNGKTMFVGWSEDIAGTRIAIPQTEFDRETWATAMKANNTNPNFDPLD